MKNRSLLWHQIAIGLLVGTLLTGAIQYRRMQSKYQQMEQANKALVNIAEHEQRTRLVLQTDLNGNQDYPLLRIRQVEQENAQLRAENANLKASVESRETVSPAVWNPSMQQAEQLLKEQKVIAPKRRQYTREKAPIPQDDAGH